MALCKKVSRWFIQYDRWIINGDIVWADLPRTHYSDVFQKCAKVWVRDAAHSVSLCIEMLALVTREKKNRKAEVAVNVLTDI